MQFELLFVLFALCGLVSSKNSSYTTCLSQPTTIQCPSFKKINSSANRPASKAEDYLNSYVEQQQIKIPNFGTNLFKWIYNPATVIEARHIRISFYYRSKGETNVTHVPHCCQVPLETLSCDQTIPGDFYLYYSLTLFRSTIIKYIGFIQSSARRFPFPTFNLHNDVDLPPPEWLEHIRYKVADLYSYVCLFSLHKDDVLESAMKTPDLLVISSFFQREVYKHPGYIYKDDRICSQSSPEEIECTTMSFEEDAVYNLSSTNIDRDLFTCLVVWFSLTASDDIEVYCMPQNATVTLVTTPASTTLNVTAMSSPKSPTRLVDNNQLPLIVIVCSVGAFLIMMLLIFCIFRWRRRLDNLFKFEEDIPNTLTTTMKESATQSFDTTWRKESFTAYDESERIRISKSAMEESKSQTKNNFQNDKEKQFSRTEDGKICKLEERLVHNNVYTKREVVDNNCMNEKYGELPTEGETNYSKDSGISVGSYPSASDSEAEDSNGYVADVAAVTLKKFQIDCSENITVDYLPRQRDSKRSSLSSFDSNSMKEINVHSIQYGIYSTVNDFDVLPTTLADCEQSGVAEESNKKGDCIITNRQNITPLASNDLKGCKNSFGEINSNCVYEKHNGIDSKCQPCVSTLVLNGYSCKSAFTLPIQ